METIKETINMKEKLYTIPLNDAVNENDECPFCFIERKLEQDMINFVLGSSSSYMRVISVSRRTRSASAAPI